MSSPLRRLTRDAIPPIIGLGILVLYGTIAFSYFERIDYFDSFYWTITVLSTVGFGDITPTTIYGKIVFITLIILGLSMFGYFITILTSFLTEQRILRDLFIKVIESGKMKNHIILLGWDNYIKYAYDEVKANGYTPIIVVEDEMLGKSLSRKGYNVVVTSIGEENFIDKVRLNSAKAIIISNEDSSKVILTILKIRRMNKEIPIIASYYDKELKEVLLQAGADQLVNLSEVGGRLLANQVFEPYAAKAAIDLLSRGGLDLMEATVSPKNDGKTISSLKKEGMRSNVLMIEREGHVIAVPPDDFTLRSGDKLVLVGLSDILELDKKIVSG